MVTALNVNKISKSFQKSVLDKVSFEVKQGEIFGFIGLNGVGKTTLIKIILDLLEQDDGEVEIFGVSRILPKSRQKLCYLPEKFQPSSHLKGEEFLRFVLNFYKKKLDLNKAYEICDRLNLDRAVLKQKVTKYSKGMTQKLGLLAVFLTEADLIILDEPMSGLDPKARIALKDELMAYKAMNKTIFFSSHILSDMDEICDSIAILHDSRIRYCGAPDQFKKKYQENSLEKAFLCEIGIK